MSLTEAIGFVRSADSGTRTIEGIAIPYGVLSNPTALVAGSNDVIRETWMPGAFRESVDSWSRRADGRRMPFRPAHGEKPVGVVTELADTPEGVAFRASIFDTPAGNEYLRDVAAGLNGVSAEGIWNARPGRTKDGTLVHRSGRLFGIAGAVSPAFDAAHVALRDMEEALAMDDTTQGTEPVAEREALPQPDERAETAQRVQAERQTVAELRPSSITITRPEAIYRSTGEYLLDAYRAQMKHDGVALERQERYRQLAADASVQIERASDVLVSEIPGMYPNDYLPSLLTPRILKGRPMGGFFNRVPVADARPRVFAKVTTSGSVVTAADGSALTGTDIATTAVTVTPAIYGAYTDISRAAFDGGDPSTVGMVFQDLTEAYSQASETVIKTAVEAGASASGVAITAATPFAGTLNNVINYYGTRFRSATGAFIPSALFSVLLSEGDTAGRPKMPLLNPTNSDGTAAPGGARGTILDATTYLSWASTTNVCVFSRPEDYVIFESPVATFTFEQATGGPHAVRVGVWAYIGVGARLGGLKVTAA